MSIERLLDEARAVDCAIRLGDTAWAVASAGRLAADLTGHERELSRGWNGLDGGVSSPAVAEARAVRTALRILAADLGEERLPVGSGVYSLLQGLIHQEAVAAADAAVGLVD